MSYIALFNIYIFVAIMILVFTGQIKKHQSLAYFAAICSILFAIFSVWLSLHVAGLLPDVEVSWT